MFEKIRDHFDTEVSVNVVVEDQQGLDLLLDVLKNDVKRYQMEILKSEDSSLTVVSIKYAYNRYREMMRSIQSRGYNLKQMSRTGLIDKLIKC